MGKTVFDSMRLDGKVAVITGGAGLLGEKHAEAVTEAGAIAVLLDTNEDKLIRVTATIESKYGVRCHGIRCDITEEKEIQDCQEQIERSIGPVEILINNAALDPKVSKNSPDSHNTLNRLEDFDLAQWNLELSVGLTGSFLCAKMFGRDMASRRSGVIINVSSDLGIIAPDQRLYRKEGVEETKQPVKPVTYSVIKHGLIGLTKYLTTYWANSGIRVNTLCPAGVYTNQPDEFVMKISELIPMKRMAFVHEYKAAIVFLASDASSYMTGQTLIIDGGRSIL